MWDGKLSQRGEGGNQYDSVHDKVRQVWPVHQHFQGVEKFTGEWGIDWTE